MGPAPKTQQSSSTSADEAVGKQQLAEMEEYLKKQVATNYHAKVRLVISFCM